MCMNRSMTFQGLSPFSHPWITLAAIFGVYIINSWAHQAWKIPMQMGKRLIEYHFYVLQRTTLCFSKS